MLPQNPGGIGQAEKFRDIRNEFVATAGATPSDVWATFMRRGWQREISLRLSGTNAPMPILSVYKKDICTLIRIVLPCEILFTMPKRIGLW